MEAKSRISASTVARKTRAFSDVSRRRIAALGGLVLLAAVSVIAISARSAKRRSMPHSGGLAVDQYTFDFGILSTSASVQPEHSFLLTNLTSHPIAITGKRSTCGCTTAFYNKGVIPPNGTLPVRIAAKWGGKSGIQAAQVVLTTDDVTTPRVALK